jgi:hypothetical protein
VKQVIAGFILDGIARVFGVVFYFLRYSKSLLHMGQLDLCNFHWRRQLVWNKCPHGVGVLYRGLSDPTQMGHVSSCCLPGASLILATKRLAQR